MAVIEKGTRKFIGWCGLKYSPHLDEYFRNCWNHRFATETAKRCLEFGFFDLGIDEIVGRSMIANIPSIKVLKKLGMKYRGTFDYDGQEGVIYGIRKKRLCK
jgi:[ribosomal protein S5]-alanine N-acetyltransferase